MGSFVWTGIPGVDRLRFKQFPTRVTKDTDVVRVGTVVAGKNKRTGTLYTNHALSASRSYTGYNWRGVEDLMGACEKLGVLTEEDRCAYETKVAEKKKISDLKDSIYHMEQLVGAGYGSKGLSALKRMAQQEVKVLEEQFRK